MTQAASRPASEGGHPDITETDHVAGLKAGATHGKESWGTVLVRNTEGRARSHITLQASWNVPPEVPFSIFTFPDNSKLFRDVNQVAERRVVHMEPGLKIVEVAQHQHVKVLWVHKTFTTWLKVTEDCRNPEHMVVQFDLIKSDVLSAFSGRWDIKPVKDAGGKVVACEAELNQDVLPRGVPKIAQHVPLLGDLLRGVAYRAIQRVMEDMNTAIGKIRAGMDQGHAPLDVLRQLCGVQHEEGFANGQVASHVVTDIPDEASDGEGEEDEAEQGSGKQPPASSTPASSSTHMDASIASSSAPAGSPSRSTTPARSSTPSRLAAMSRASDCASPSRLAPVAGSRVRGVGDPGSPATVSAAELQSAEDPVVNQALAKWVDQVHLS